MVQPDPSEISSLRPWWVLALVLSLLCLLIRMQTLLALPIFGDEAIYLRWAQLVREGHWWVSLCDPKPPLHFWLIAGAYSLMPDPLAGARVLSVLAGVLSVPAVMLVCDQLGRLLRRAVSGRAVGMVAAVLMIFCPFLSFYQRLGTADALFVLQSLAAAWLSLRWAQRLFEKQNAWPTAIGLGFTLGLSMLTRQGLSYTLWGLPLVAFILHALRWRAVTREAGEGAPPRFSGRELGIALGQFTLMVALSVALWTPYLVANFATSSAENGGTVAELKRRILYQTQFTASKTPMLETATRNFKKTFIPGHTHDNGKPSTLPTAGWLFLYLTPAVYLTCLLGLLYMAVRREWAVLLFLLAWLVLMLGPPIVMGNVIFSRYVLAGVPPLLIGGAFVLTSTLTWVVSRRFPAAILWGVAGLILAGLLALPLREIGKQTKYWRTQTLTAQDHYQYITGWPSGLATRSAIRALERASASGALVLITDAGWGNPADAAWAYLSNNPNVTLYYRIPELDGEQVLKAVGNDAYVVTLRKDKFLFSKPEQVMIPRDTPVFLLTNDPIHTPQGEVSAEAFFRRSQPNLGAPITFYGVDGANSEERVILLPVR